MTTMELRQSLFQEIAHIMDSDELTRKTLEYIRKLRMKEAKKNEVKEDLSPYTIEEINSWIDEAEEEEYREHRMKKYSAIWKRNILGYANISNLEKES